MTKTPPALFIAPGNLYGRVPRPGRPDPRPVMPEEETPLMAAAWTCHLIVKATRAAYLAAGYQSDHDFYSSVGLSEKTWKKFFSGATWVTVEQVADLVAIFGPDFATTVGRAYSQMAVAQTLRQSGNGGTRRRTSRPLVYTTRQRSATHAKARPGASVSDAFWDSLSILSERHGVESPTELHITESSEPWVSGTPGSAVIAGVPDLHADNWLIINGHLQLDPFSTVQLDLLPAEEDEGALTFQAVPSSTP